MAQIEENLRTMRDQYISMENEVLGALQNMYQKEIDEHNRAIEEKNKKLMNNISARFVKA